MYNFLIGLGIYIIAIMISFIIYLNQIFKDMKKEDYQKIDIAAVFDRSKGEEFCIIARFWWLILLWCIAEFIWKHCFKRLIYKIGSTTLYDLHEGSTNDNY